MLMLYEFLDESYTADRYYIGALIVEQQHLPELEAALSDARAYAKGFGIDTPDIEFHAHSMMTGRDGWEPVKGKARAAIAIYEYALRRIAELPVRMVIRGLDVERLNARYRYPYPPHRITLAHALEVVDDYAERRREMVTVIADEVQDQAEHIAQAARYQLTGTGGYLSRRLLQIEMPILFESSATSPGIQCADLIAYLYRRLDAHTETNPHALAAVERMWSTLQPIRHHVWRWDP